MQRLPDLARDLPDLDVVGSLALPGLASLNPRFGFHGLRMGGVFGCCQHHANATADFLIAMVIVSQLLKD